MNRSLMNSLIIIWLFISCFTDSTKYSGSLKSLILKHHNDARTAVRNGQARGRSGYLPAPKSLPNMRWSDSLASTASRYADSCEGAVSSSGAKICVHSKQSIKNGRNWWDRNGLASQRAGENIGCPWNQGPMNEFKINHWLKTEMIDKELKKYAYGDDPMGSGAGHYTQIIWAKSTQVGCGYSQCSTGWIFVCHYKAIGNYRGVPPYEKGGSSSGGWDGDWGFDAFNAGDIDTSCFQNYAKTLHFYNNKTLPSHIFERDESLGCHNNEPVYRYNHERFGIHAMLYYSSEAIQWVINSTDATADYRFVCSKVNLYECTKGRWSSLYAYQYDDENQVYDPTVNGSVGSSLYTEERYLVMENAHIKSISPKNAAEDSGFVIAVVIICIVVVIFIVFASWYFIRYRNKHKTNLKQLEIPDEEEEEEEEEEEVEVTVPITATS